MSFCDTCGHQYSTVCCTCESLDGVPVKYSEKQGGNMKQFKLLERLEYILGRFEGINAGIDGKIHEAMLDTCELLEEIVDELSTGKENK